ncbi:related to SAS10 protein, involved in silencing [Cephalotrichum gorgonifer]|uniref:Related to SAS10 protein, involved in silencing n=1 Tax=Cephalotrichum gorgonifer TaxID=2041049 RepID=A0AAE8N0A4_9PEZI|nr:related to SAS10 protein, involved in silencing [Cephalotrichum gorgonifer]
MGKKRKASKAPVPKGPREVDAADARLGPITTYADVADSEDEHFLQQDEIRFDDEPQTKRQRRLQEEADFLEDSDVEIFGDDGDDSDADSIVAAVKKGGAKQKKKQKKKDTDDSEDEEEEPEDEGDENWWGSSRKEYYDNDNIETEADALEEEAEAKRLQQKKLSKMAEEDFIFDENEWAQAKDSEEKGDVVTEVLGDAEIPEDMSAEDRYALLTTRYPEFEPLVEEFQELHPQLAALQKAAEGMPAKSVASVKHWILGCYVAALAGYFALLTSPVRDGSGAQRTMDPAELRDHEIMETLVTCRNQWNRVKTLEPPSAEASPEPDSDTEMVGLSVEAVEAAVPEAEPKELRAKKPKKGKKKTTATTSKTSEEIEESLADLYDLPLTTKKAKKRSVSKSAPAEDDNSDFGEEDALNAEQAAEKAQRKKSLRFYTSQIVQKANKRAGAGRDAGGDMDIPYRERLKDRQERLNKLAEKRGLKHGEGLDEGGDDDDDAATAAAMRGNEDEYYDMVASASSKKKTEKKDRAAALAAATAADRVVPVEVVGEDGKRKITFQIEKNKGLTPHRKKENRNARVKKRKAYESKMKKLSSVMPVYKAEPKGGYAGVTTGIKAGLIRSTKF